MGYGGGFGVALKNKWDSGTWFWRSPQK